MKVFLDEFFFYNLDESVPKRSELVCRFSGHSECVPCIPRWLQAFVALPVVLASEVGHTRKRSTNNVLLTHPFVSFFLMKVVSDESGF